MGGIGPFTSGRSTILITIGGVNPPLQHSGSIMRCDFNNADWGRYRDSVRRKLSDYRPTGNQKADAECFAQIVMTGDESSISKTDPRGA